MTVLELARELLCNHQPDATVVLGHAPGKLGRITGTVNGFVILDATLDESPPCDDPACACRSSLRAREAREGVKS